jgi:ribonuclease HI
MRILYCDGACSGNPGPAGSAAILIDLDGTRIETSVSRWIGVATNQIAELNAFLLALDIAGALGTPATIRSDSEYVVKGVNEWLPNWKRDGWRNARRKPVANHALWKAIDAKLVLIDPRPTAVLVRGHAGDRWNHIVDGLAVQASRAARQPEALSTAAVAGGAS